MPYCKDCSAWTELGEVNVGGKWKRDNAAAGQCRRRAPKPISAWEAKDTGVVGSGGMVGRDQAAKTAKSMAKLESGSLQVWPITLADDWCLEGVQKQT